MASVVKILDLPAFEVVEHISGENPILDLDVCLPVLSSELRDERCIEAELA